MTSLGHSRSSSLADNRNRPMAANGVFSPPPQAGRNGGDGRPGGAPIPHIDDILAAPRDIDMNQSIRKLLESAEASLRQAEMSRDFNRPALAFKDYIRASVIAIQTIRNHRDYSSLERDHIDLARAHRSLLKRISQQDDTFARIKQDIIADNKRTGVRPVSQHVKSSQENGVSSHSRSPSKAARDVDSTLSSVNRSPTMSPRSSLNGSRAKVKPAIQPKPQALHGSAIGSARSSLSLSVTAAQEIAARFANLRGPQSSPGQDPRIKTHQIIPPKPAGPREMPMSPPRPPKIDINTNVPSLPKIPDAIYSPRGSISGETPRPPGTTRNVYNRNGSTTPSVPGTPTQQSQAQADYFAPTQSYSNILIPPTPPENAIKVPEGDSITPDQLYQAMKAKGSILVIDTRVREDFDEGHIMSSSTICIEPSILLRDNLSADQISESLVLSPNQEESLFEQRDKYDLVVFYDHDSEEVRKTPLNSEDLVLISLRRALVDFNYLRDLKNPPKILKGGIVAWVDLMGPSSLQSSTQTAMQRPKPPTKHIRSTGIERTKSKYIVKPLKPDDVKAWQETLKNDDIDTASSPNFLRSKEDFLRRFPPVATEQESMISQESTSSQGSMTLQNHSQEPPAYGLSHKVDLYTDLPSPPTRPAPAMPRPSYNGLSEVANESDPYGQANTTSTNRQVARVPKAAEQPLSMDNTKFYTGLNNPNNWCYANSTLQCFLASPGFGRDLADSTWLTKYKAPKKDDEKIEQPQLMIRIVTNLFHWMNSGKFKVMKAQTLMNYSHHLYKQGQAYQPFGSDQQQDASEFLTFLLTHIDDETNTRRDRKGFVAQPDTKRGSLLQAAAEYWHDHLGLRNSIIDRYWRGLELGTVYCFECQNKTHTFATFDGLTPPVNGSLRMSLDQVLNDYTSDSVIDDFSCDTCRRSTRARQTLSLARMPPLLCICLKRFRYQLDIGRTKKSPAPITWDFNDTDVSRYFIQPKDDLVPPNDTIDTSDPALTGPFRYETYAVIVHEGPSVTSGHYTAYVRDTTSHDPYAWLYCNDSSVTKVRIGSGDTNDAKESVFKSGKDRVPYLIFLRRKGMR